MRRDPTVTGYGRGLEVYMHMERMSHDSRKSIGGVLWCVAFDDAADDMFAHWPLESPRRGGHHFYALESKCGVALPPPHGPDFAEILLGFVL